MKCFTTVGTKRLDALSLLKKIKKYMAACKLDLHTEGSIQISMFNNG